MRLEKLFGTGVLALSTMLLSMADPVPAQDLQRKFLGAQDEYSSKVKACTAQRDKLAKVGYYPKLGMAALGSVVYIENNSVKLLALYTENDFCRTIVLAEYGKTSKYYDDRGDYRYSYQWAKENGKLCMYIEWEDGRISRDYCLTRFNPSKPNIIPAN